MKVIIIAVLIVVKIGAQWGEGAKQAALCNSALALAGDAFAIFNSSANILQINSRQFGAEYTPGKFGFKQLSSFHFAYVEPFSNFSIGVGLGSYGFELYKENELVLGLACEASKGFIVSASTTLSNLKIQNYGISNSLLINVSTLYYINEKLRTGFAVNNINGASRGNEAGQIPIVFLYGWSWDVSEDFVLNIATEKETGFPFAVMAGFLYKPVKYFSLRSGAATNPTKYSAGFGLTYSHFQFDYAVYTHPVFELTHQFGVIFSFLPF
ncbi:MAG TPA: hypothetical protein PLT92_10185 [Ignavibacteriaceae bacterium]|nr:hypothetical protein [Ignavibacteriaceae bacterium]